MKKFTLCLFFLPFVIAINATAGNNRSQHVAPLTFHPSPTVNGINFYTEDFAGGIPGTWQINDSSSSGIDWRWTITGSKYLPPSLSQNYLSSNNTSAANGYAILDADSAYPPSQTQNSWLISDAIDATGKTGVHLTFNEFFAQYQGATGVVWVSNDGLNWTDVHHAETGLNQDETTTNPDAVDVDISAIADNQATVYVAFQYTGFADYFWMVDDVNLYEVPASDIGVISIWEPIGDCSVLTATENVSVTIFNFGGDSISNFQVAYVFDGGTPVVETVTDTIASGDFKDYTFTQTGDFSTAGNHTITAYTILTGDVDMTNDTTTITLFSGPHMLNPNYSMGFEVNDDLTGWNVLDNNSDGVTWTLSTSAPHSGSWHAAYNKNLPGNGSDDWLFSTCLQLDAGVIYSVSFWYRTFSPATDALMRAGIHSAQTPTSNVATLFPLDTVKNFTWLQDTSYISVSTSGAYYIAWQVQADAAKNASLYIDDVNIVSAVGVPTLHSAGKDVIVFPNPSNGSFVIGNLNLFKGQVQISVLDMMGRIAYQTEVVNTNQLNLNLQNQASGVYTVVIRDAEGVTSKLITIQ